MTWTTTKTGTTGTTARTATRKWRQVRARVLARDGHQCTVTTPHGRCPSPAVDVHHLLNVANGGTDDEDNLVSICKPHHDAETKREAAAARWSANQRTSRPVERHPGLL